MTRRKDWLEIAVLAILGTVAWLALPEIVASLRGRSPSPSGAAALERTSRLFGVGWLLLAGCRLAIERFLPALSAPRAASLGVDDDRDPPNLRAIALTILPAIVVLVLALSVASRSWSYDEILSLQLDVRRPFPEALLPHGVFANHVLATVYAKIASLAVGTGEASLRITFALPMAAAAALASWVAWRVTSSAGWATWTGLAIALHPLIAGVALQMRGYGFLVLGSSIVGLSMVQAEGSSKRVASALALVGATIAATSHLFGLLFVGLLVVAVIARSVSGRARFAESPRATAARRELSIQWIRALSIAWVAWLPALPWVFFSLDQQRLQSSELGRRALVVLVELLGGDGELRISPLLAIAVVTGAVVGARRLGALREWPWAAVLLTLLVLAASWLLSPRFFFARFLLVCLPGWMLLATVGFRAMRRFGTVVAALVLMGFVMSTSRRLQDLPDLRGAMRQLSQDQAASTFEWCLDPRGEEGIVLRHYAPEWIASCDLESPSAGAPGKAWIALDGGGSERALEGVFGGRARSRVLYRVGGRESDLVAWLPRAEARTSPSNESAN